MKKSKSRPAVPGAAEPHKVQVVEPTSLPANVETSYSSPDERLRRSNPKSRTKSATPSASTGSAPTFESEFQGIAAVSPSIRKTEWKKLKRPQRDFGFGRKRTLGDYARQIRADKCGFFYLCLLSLIIIVAIMAASIVVIRKYKLETHERTRSTTKFRRPVRLVESTWTTVSRVKSRWQTPELKSGSPLENFSMFVNETRTKNESIVTVKIVDFIDLNKICRSPPLGHRCSYHTGRVRQNCTHVICDSVMINLDYYNNKFHPSRAGRRIIKSPAADGERCIHKDSFGHCYQLKCLPGANTDSGKQIDDADNVDDDVGGTWSVVKNLSDPEACLNITLKDKISAFTRCGGGDTDCSSVVSRIEFRTCLVPKKSRSGRLPCFDNAKSTSELLPMQLIACPNVCPDADYSQLAINCPPELGCKNINFIPCCFKTVVGGFSPGRCILGLCVPIKNQSITN